MWWHSPSAFLCVPQSQRVLVLCWRPLQPLLGSCVRHVVTLFPLCGTYLDGEGGSRTPRMSWSRLPWRQQTCAWGLECDFADFHDHPGLVLFAMRLMWLVAAAILTMNNLTTVAILAIFSSVGSWRLPSASSISWHSSPEG